MTNPRTAFARVAFWATALMAVLAIAGPTAAQDFSTTIESRDFPLENRSRTVIVEADLRPHSYYLVMAPRTRVVDNHADVVARRAETSFDARFEASVERRAEIFALYRRLSR